MINVSHAGNTELRDHFAHTGSQRATTGRETPENTQEHTGDEDEEETAWLQSIQAAGSENLTAVKGLDSGNLVMDINQLKEAPSAAKRSLKARLPS